MRQYRSGNSRTNQPYYPYPLTFLTINKESLTAEMRSNVQEKVYRYLRFMHIKDFSVVADNSNLPTGVTAMLGLAGVGKVKPNILMIWAIKTTGQFAIEIQWSNTFLPYSK